MNKLARVDFTDGLIFSKNHKEIGENLNYLTHIGLEFPWSVSQFEKIESDRDLEEKEKELFFTGTNREIKFRAEIVKLEKGELCECCGRKINNLPWVNPKKYPFLCDECSRDMERDYGCDLFDMPKRTEIVESHWWLAP